ncbi:hypothetical protein H4R26_000249 [Coemansia thaxteri]|uniref:AA9 family lytic polysaccharide monooxygenase n=1 Tax=Coemansia thaxteri TaxID=2663907 RepID=A0A9W8EKD9_9FUNG|nr:hypothetical protein H4R26_000249 [Coemansia thaxteri]
MFVKGMVPNTWNSFDTSVMFPLSYPGTTPAMDMTSPDMVCRTANMSIPPANVLAVTSDQTLYIQFDTNNRSPINTGYMSDKNIWGPCTVYLASTTKVNNTYRWFNIYSYAGDGTAWCSEKIVGNAGTLGVPMKKNLKSGTYIIRVEIIGLNMANTQNTLNKAMGAQIFSTCGMIQYTNTIGGTDAPAGVVFPGYYDPTNTVSLLVDPMLTKAISYTLPAPPEYAPATHDGGSGVTP